MQYVIYIKTDFLLYCCKMSSMHAKCHMSAKSQACMQNVT